MPRLLMIKGFGGPAATIFAPLFAELGELSVIYERTETTFLDLDPAAEREAVEAVGAYVEVGSPEEIPAAALAEAAERPPDGIITLSEPLLRTTAEIARELGLSHTNPVETARIVTDKYEQREALRRVGMPTPRHARISSAADLDPALEAVGLPAVLKPAFGAGSMLIFEVDSAADLHRHYGEAIERHCRSELVRGTDPVFDLEQRIPSEDWHGDERFGNYVSVEVLMAGGAFHALNVSDRTRQLPPFRETGLLLPSSLPPDRRTELIDAARGACEAIGATDGPFHVEVMTTPDGPVVIEINGRVGGSIPYIYEQITDVELFRETAKIALGIEPITAPEFDGHGGMFNIHAPGEGAVTKLEGLDAARELPGVRQMMVAVHEGDRVSSMLGLLGGMIRVIAAAPTVDELFAIRERVMETVSYEVG
ncbi:MAG: ATP-grasp domain-containing protein [Actinobacteria bacterium]|nr:ATP-grasp domain-containing protein [Actinomycetota bacterium]